MSPSFAFVLLFVASKAEIFGREGTLELDSGGSVKAVDPVGLLSVAKEGQWGFNPKTRMISLAYKRYVLWEGRALSAGGLLYIATVIPFDVCVQHGNCVLDFLLCYFSTYLHVAVWPLLSML